MQHILYLKIENQVHSATITAINHPQQQLYHVLFEDGYENIFFMDAETGGWIEEDMGETELSASFGARVRLLFNTGCRPNRSLIWCRATIAGKLVLFGFCSHTVEGLTIFEVYAGNRKFLCSLTKHTNGQWQIDGMERPETKQRYTNLVQIIISILEGMADRHQ